jgi:uridine kinase
MRKKPFMIGIAGPTCSGKTELAKCISYWAPAVSPVVIHLDSYYRDLSHLDADERASRNVAGPEAMDWDLVLEQVMAIARGGEIEHPIYDYWSHERSPRTERISAGDLIVIEGVFALYREDLREMYDLSVFVDVDLEVCLGRKLQRDIGRRSRSIQSIIRQYAQTIRPMYEKHVLPTEKFAEIVVRGEQPTEKSAAKIMAHLNQSFRFQLTGVGI